MVVLQATMDGSFPTTLTPFLPHLWTTLQHRPYVFAFLIAFLIFGRLQFGWLRTFLFLFLGWVIAFASEVSSIRNGFPYGDYKYIYENLKGELILWGVPLWDSLSYTFLAYASFSTATFLCYPTAYSRSEFWKQRTSFKVLLLSVVLMAGIDVVIDPLAHLGDRWFLGKIYYYPRGGFYFDVPASNFIGWVLVAFCILFIFQRLDKTLENKGLSVPSNSGFKKGLGAALYLGVFFFNWGITVWLREWKLALADLLLISPLLIALIRKRKLSIQPSQSTE